MCGIIGIVAHGPVNQSLYDGLTVLQHRGQDAAGIITSDGQRLHLRKNNGLVRDVFHTRHMLRLHGDMGIGHQEIVDVVPGIRPVDVVELLLQAFEHILNRP